MSYNNLAAELARYNISFSEAAEALGIESKTFRNKMQGKSQWTWSQVCTMRGLLPHKLDLDYLFATSTSNVA